VPNAENNRIALFLGPLNWLVSPNAEGWKELEPIMTVSMSVRTPHRLDEKVRSRAVEEASNPKTINFFW